VSWRLAILVGLTLAVAGCNSLRTASEAGPGCQLLTAAEGILKADLVWGLGLEGRGGFRGVVWPFGFTARRDGNGILLLVDRDGNVLAREGDRIAMAAKGSDDGVTYVCDPPNIRVVDAAEE
jgi:hypothetical protein